MYHGSQPIIGRENCLSKQGSKNQQQQYVFVTDIVVTVVISATYTITLILEKS
jgi:hypothetical protein